MLYTLSLILNIISMMNHIFSITLLFKNIHKDIKLYMLLRIRSHIRFNMLNNIMSHYMLNKAKSMTSKFQRN